MADFARFTRIAHCKLEKILQFKDGKRRQNNLKRKLRKIGKVFERGGFFPDIMLTN